MIAANELRIGNWIFLHEKRSRTKHYQIASGHDIEEIEGCPEQTSPIVLTPEMLEKAGFEWDIFWQGFAEKQGRYYLQQADNGGYNVFNGKWKQQINWMRPIQYLHQLQNLYFALTGTELPIEL